MPLKKFPTATKQWISLPADLVGDPGGTSSYELELPYAEVPVITDALPDDPNRFKPLVKLELVAPLLVSSSCNRFPYRRNSGMSRISIYLAKIEPAAWAEPGSAPPVVELQFRQVVENHPVVRSTGALTCLSYDDDGWMLQIEGLLSSGIEVWGRVPPGINPVPVNIYLSAIFDRLGGPDKILRNTPFYQ